ncbi:hypothetical protein H0H93_001481 [Arthromyces matolae]|nr:hypothetical protein H0H93_001481 [Arthromyces matolae]
MPDSSFHRTNRHKTWTRYLNTKQLQWQLGDTLAVYKTFMKSEKLPLVIDELDEGARLLWIGKKRTDRVILYFHALVPTARFPVQLKQAVLAVQHLIAEGVEPKNLQLTGDSAGANLILALFSHALHPVPNVPRLELSGPIRGAYLLSPWLAVTKEGSMTTNDDSDIIGTDVLLYWGNTVLRAVPDKYSPYMEASTAPKDWFAKLSDVVERVLITAGDAECLRDSIVTFADRLRGEHPKVDFVLQKYGVHDDPYFDFYWPEKKQGELTPVILDFFASGFDHET